MELTDGRELQTRLSQRPDWPVIYVTRHPSVRTAVRAMQAGAVDVLSWPGDAQLLPGAIELALQRSRAEQKEQARRHALSRRYESLSGRERQVMERVVDGMLNKNIAVELGIAEYTVKVHRGRVMRKMQAASLPDLVNMATTLRAARSIPADGCRPLFAASVRDTPFR